MDPVTAGGLAYFAVVAILLTAWTVARRYRPAWVQRIDGAYPAVILFFSAGTAVSIEVMCEPYLQRTIPWDLTRDVVAVEGTAALAFQQATRTAWLDPVLVGVYLAGALVLYHAPLVVLALKGRAAAAWRYALTMAVVWGVGIAFYILVPVREAWAWDAAVAPVNVLFEQIPDLRTAPGFVNNIDNNFPSLHTAVSVAVVAALAWSGERKLALLAAPLAAAVVVSTVYLGVHWWIDVAAGIALGIGGAWVAHKVGAGRAPAAARGGRGRPTA